MKRFLLLISTILLSTSFSLTAQAELTHAGTPDELHVETNPGFEFPDIYQRQLEYREKRLLLIEDMKERQKHFIAPSLEAQALYQKDVQALHKSIK